MRKKVGMEMRANGKINLYLDVLSDGASGFHEIKSIMQSVSLCDRVTVSAVREQSKNILLSCNLPYIPCDARNIAYKAADLFLTESAINAEVRIRLQKRIPVAGGMAGGSADGAAVLRGLNKLFGEPLTAEKLSAVAAKLGSDIPFCLWGKTAICTGRGEILEPIPCRAKLLLLIVPSSESVSTPWAYAELDKRFGDFGGRKAENAPRFDALCTALAADDTAGIAENMYNIFEEAILPQRPLAQRAKELLLAHGAIGAMMSGSGPTVFGIFPDMEARKSAEAALKKEGYSPKKAETIL
ncbi:MAG: 4-(cytidine 5'-diphospho)-2-C-methyl-D-erythritol kinase [Clostridia bacterium]|nr:4-(cytidine 5'-diphospho)-2-C-methyl-D-erythritol kinase [Clostridia bacterium]